MNQSVRYFLEGNEIDIPTEDPPSDAQDTKNPIDLKGKFKNFNSYKMYQAAGDVSYPESNEDRYLHLRQYYINQVKGEKQRAKNETMSGAFKRIINDEPLEKIEGYYTLRQRWRQEMHEQIKDGKKICHCQNCINVALPGSDYCINHILEDKNQKLFIACPKCHRPHPFFSVCFTCGV